jgi:hypothetical protein
MIGCIGLTLVRLTLRPLASISCKSTNSHRVVFVQHSSMAQCYDKTHQSITFPALNSLKGGLPTNRSCHHNRNHETVDCFFTTHRSSFIDEFLVQSSPLAICQNVGCMDRPTATLKITRSGPVRKSLGDKCYSISISPQTFLCGLHYNHEQDTISLAHGKKHHDHPMSHALQGLGSAGRWPARFDSSVDC